MRKVYKYLLFDLDGTLLNTFEGVSRSVAYTLEAMGRPVPEEKEMRSYLGPPLRDSFRDLAGMNEADSAEAVRLFRSRYDVKGVYEYCFFEELPPVLGELKRRGFTLAVATSKIEDMARKILSHAGIAEYFSYIGGSTRSGERIKKADVISYVLEALNVTDKSETLMIGDREHDVIGAHENGIDCCGLLCGFGSAEEFKRCGADMKVTYIADLLEIL